MKKTRIDLSVTYPKYFAVTGRGEAFAELTDADIANLDKLEAALPGAAPAAAESSESESQAAAAPVQSVDLSALTQRLDTQAQEITALKAQLAGAPAAAHTTVETTAGAEGGAAGAEPKAERVISETEALLNELRGKK